jgi:hypothetical protein
MGPRLRVLAAVASAFAFFSFLAVLSWVHGNGGGTELLSLPLPLGTESLGRHAAHGRRKSVVQEKLHVSKSHLGQYDRTVLYDDWRGVSLEKLGGVDEFSFSHSWAGSVDIQEREQTVVKQPQLELAKRSASSALSDTKAALQKQYNVALDGDWSPGQAQAVLDVLDDLCSTSVHAKDTPTENCGMSDASKWKIHDGRLVDDVMVDGERVSLAKHALDFGASRGAKLEGEKGTVVSRRLQFAVLRVVTDYGKDKKVVGKILQRRFGAQLHVDPGYTKLTSVTTYEDAERFQHFKAPELLFMLEAWSLMPPTMYDVAGLKYVTRRQEGLDHPLYGSTTAVSWPTNLDQSYQEYMDYSFNNDGYTSRHLFIHEKTHFFWGRHWRDSLKQEWEQTGKWRQQGAEGEWGTSTTTPFASDYGASNNPDEDLAECMAAYVLHPLLLQARAPAKADFIATHIARGVRYLERPDVTVHVPNDSPYRRYPASLTQVKIRVSGAPTAEKEVDVQLLLNVGHGWHSPVHAEVSLAGPSGGHKLLNLYPDPAHGGEDGEDGVVTLRTRETFSRLYEKGFWSASQIKVKDKLGNERWVKVGDYSWRLYLNNQVHYRAMPEALHTTYA